MTTICSLPSHLFFPKSADQLSVLSYAVFFSSMSFGYVDGTAWCPVSRVSIDVFIIGVFLWMCTIANNAITLSNLLGVGGSNARSERWVGFGLPGKYVQARFGWDGEQLRPVPAFQFLVVRRANHSSRGFSVLVFERVSIQIFRYRPGLSVMFSSSGNQVTVAMSRHNWKSSIEARSTDSSVQGGAL